MNRWRLIQSFFLSLIVLFLVKDAYAEVKWHPWSNDLFSNAGKENRLIVLDLEAVWCHWCHVMEQETYGNPKIDTIIRERFIAVKVDQDARPDISRRYEDYGWPATIIFNAKGEEIVKLSGYQEPKEFLAILRKAIKDPTPQKEERVVTKESNTTELSDALQTELRTKHQKGIDPALGGSKSSHKFLDSDSIEYALTTALSGDATEAAWVRRTLDNNLKLVDRAWGGAYQYSTDSDWDHPHFEKIMQTQSTNLQLYSYAFGIWKDPKYKEAAQDIYRYVTTILSSPDGVFYTSQDADVVDGRYAEAFFALNAEQRAEKGMPRIDMHIYSRENGWAIEGITSFAAATNDQSALEHAQKAAEWIYAYRRGTAGGYTHDKNDASGPFLGDSVQMGRAYLALYGATGDRIWLSRAEEAAQFIAKTFFIGDKSGAVTVKPDPADLLPPVRSTDENIELTRFANLLSKYSGDGTYRQLAERSMQYLTDYSVATAWITGDGILIAAKELERDPLHLTIVGHKDDPVAQALFAAARQVPSTYKRLEWWDKREGKMPNGDVQYPELDKAAIYICSNKQCSLPILKPEDIERTVAHYSKWSIIP